MRQYIYSALLLLVLVALAWVTNGCCPKPKPPLPPKVVVVRKPCMDPRPKLDPPVLPDVPEDADGVVIRVEDLRKLRVFLLALRTYLDTQEARCALPP